MNTVSNIVLAIVFGFISSIPIASAGKEVPHQIERQDMPGAGKHYQYDEAKSEESYKSETIYLSKIQSLVNLMNEQMGTIHSEENLDKRKMLMKEHNKTMHSAMIMMQRYEGISARPNNGYSSSQARKYKIGNHSHITKQMSPERRADLMENHMVIMQQLLNQMMEFDDAMQSFKDAYDETDTLK